MSVPVAANGFYVRIKVTPGAKKNSINGWMDLVDGGQALKVGLTAIAEDGKANKALIAFLAKAWKLPKSHIVIKSGQSNRNKLIFIQGDPEALEKLIKS